MDFSILTIIAIVYFRIANTQLTSLPVNNFQLPQLRIHAQKQQQQPQLKIQTEQFSQLQIQSQQLPQFQVRTQQVPQVQVRTQQLPQVQIQTQQLPQAQLRTQQVVQQQPPLQIPFENLLDEEWMAFKLTYNKSYQSQQEENFRREVFIENRYKIARFNQEYGAGRRTFVQQLNSFADLLNHEFNRALNGFNRTRSRTAIPTPSTFIPSANVAIPDYIDWRDVGAVSSVKNQGLCAGCYAFSAAGALEGHNFRKTGNLVELSAQNLIDCSQPQGNEGCMGGLMEPSYEYVRINPGIDTDSSYTYEAKDAQCRFRPETIGSYCTGYVGIAEGDEKGLESAIATLGPVSVAIDAGRDSFQFYSDGIYFEKECTSRAEDLNHAVLVVGYGTEPNGKKYWMVKNSYGPQWGIGGYIKMAKDLNNHCGIATQATYPLV